MKKILAGTMYLGAVTAMLIVLAGCVPVGYAPSTGYSDPVYDLGVAQVRATAVAQQMRATAEVVQAQAQAQAMQMTAVQGDFERQLTSTAVAVQARQTEAAAALQAEGTATAWAVTQTPLAATQQAMAVQARRMEQQAQAEAIFDPIRRGAGVAAIVALLVLVVMGAIKLWPKLMRLMNVLERRASTIVSEDGQMITIIPTDDEVNVVNPLNAFFPVMQVGQRGGVGSAMAPSAEMQNAQNSRAQTVALAHAIQSKGGGGAGRTGQRMLRQAMPVALPSGEAGPEPMKIEVVPAERVRGWIRDVESEVLMAALESGLEGQDESA